MSFHPQTRCNPATGLSEWHCPYCDMAASMTTTKADWAAAHGPCQAAAELLTPEELFTNYVARKP
jgi:hypothetical protein